MKTQRLSCLVTYLIFAVLAGLTIAQRFRPGGPPRRAHTVTEAKGLELIPATEQPNFAHKISITIEGEHRVIRANGVPGHQTGAFPNRGNPNPIAEQSYHYRVPAEPKVADEITPLVRQSFGIAVNGVPFDPGAAEWYLGDRDSEWRYEPLSGAIALGIDVSHAHVQPTGAYHYHGLPTHLLDTVRLSSTAHSPIIGWAADGYPIYAVYGYDDPHDKESSIKPLKSSYQLKKGSRPGGDREPSGKYDGTFVADYVYKPSSGDLDECNGRFGITPDYPEGTYAYFLTEQWPVIPRNYRGTPSTDFQRRGRPHHPPPRRRRPN